jgi:hypothetical protein
MRAAQIQVQKVLSYTGSKSLEFVKLVPCIIMCSYNKHIRCLYVFPTSLLPSPSSIDKQKMQNKRERTIATQLKLKLRSKKNESVFSVIIICRKVETNGSSMKDISNVFRDTHNTKYMHRAW